MEEGKCDSPHSIHHELGHALGLEHEQERPDRLPDKMPNAPGVCPLESVFIMCIWLSSILSKHRIKRFLDQFVKDSVI